MNVILLLFSASLTAFAGSDCIELFAKEKYGQVKSSFVHTTHYDKELPLLFTIKDQCTLSHCHLYAWSSHVEDRSKIQISNEYLDYNYLFRRSLDALDQEKTDLRTFLANTSIHSRIFIQYGLMPKVAWKPKIPIPQQPTYSRVLDSIETIILQTLWEKKRTIDLEEQVRLIKRARYQIYDLLDNIYGTPPGDFVYEGKTFLPKTFAERYFPELYLPHINVSLKTSPEQTNNYSNPRITKLYLAIEQIENLIRTVIDSGQPIYLSYSHHRQFVSEREGIMSNEAINYPPLVTPLTREQKEFYNKNGGHAVLIVGYEKDPLTGKLRKLKIQNSWGDRVGDHGFFHMYMDYFRLNFDDINFVDEGHVTLPYK